MIFTAVATDWISWLLVLQWGLPLGPTILAAACSTNQGRGRGLEPTVLGGTRILQENRPAKSLRGRLCEKDFVFRIQADLER